MTPNNRTVKERTSTRTSGRLRQQQQQQQRQQIHPPSNSQSPGAWGNGGLLSPQQQPQPQTQGFAGHQQMSPYFSRPSPTARYNPSRPLSSQPFSAQPIPPQPSFPITPAEQLTFSSLSLTSPKSTHCSVIARPSRSPIGLTPTTEQAKQAYTTCPPSQKHDSSVRLIVYDLSDGFMSRISKTVLGVPIDALYHCNIEAFGVEYWYSSGGIQATPARSFTHIHGFQPNDSIAYNTTKLKSDFEAWLRNNSQHFNGLNHAYFTENNGNNFAEAALNFLISRGSTQEPLLPKHIKDMPHTMTSSPTQYSNVLKSLIEDIIVQTTATTTTTTATDTTTTTDTPQYHVQTTAATTTTTDTPQNSELIDPGEQAGNDNITFGLSPSPSPDTTGPSSGFSDTSRFDQYIAELPTGVFTSDFSRSSLSPQRDEKSMNVYRSFIRAVQKSFYQLGRNDSGLLYPFGSGEITTNTNTTNTTNDDNDNHNECEIIFHAVYTYTQGLRPISPIPTTAIIPSPSPYALPSPSPYAETSPSFSATRSLSPYAVPGPGLFSAEKSSSTVVQTIGPLSAERWKAVAAITPATTAATTSPSSSSAAAAATVTMMTPTAVAEEKLEFLAVTPPMTISPASISITLPATTATASAPAAAAAIIITTSTAPTPATEIDTTTAITLVTEVETAVTPIQIATTPSIQEDPTEMTESLDDDVANTSSRKPTSGRMI